jgi:hypothetical protein
VQVAQGARPVHIPLSQCPGIAAYSVQRMRVRTRRRSGGQPRCSKIPRDDALMLTFQSTKRCYENSSMSRDLLACARMAQSLPTGNAQLQNTRAGLCLPMHRTSCTTVCCQGTHTLCAVYCSPSVSISVDNYALYAYCFPVPGAGCRATASYILGEARASSAPRSPFARDTRKRSFAIVNLFNTN